MSLTENNLKSMCFVFFLLVYQLHVNRMNDPEICGICDVCFVSIFFSF